MKLLVILILACLLPTEIFADTLIVLQKSNVYTSPSKKSQVALSVKKGQRLTTNGTNKNGFYQISTRSGKKVWIFSSSVKYVSTHESEDSPDRANNNFSRLTYDLGFSAGSTNNISYSEVNLGLNYFIKSWLVWRNAGFARFASQIDTSYGLDSSLRAYWLGKMGSSSGLTLFGGPGIRFPNIGDTTAFAEAGAIIQLGGFSIGGGIKSILNKLTDSKVENDTQYFIILAGSGSL